MITVRLLKLHLIQLDKGELDFMDSRFTNISTPHISVKDEPFSKTVIMPGDPKRAERIASNYLTDVRIISDIRGIKAYKGFYHFADVDKMVDVTVMASGMGMPSIGIYSHELFNFFGVEEIIRVGTVGAVNKQLKLGDIVIAQAASTNSNYLKQFGLDGYNYCPISDFDVVCRLKKESEAIAVKEQKVYVGNILSSDTFYSFSSPDWDNLGILGIEMESAALFTEAAVAGKKAGCICTVSDLTFDNTKQLTAEERQNNLNTMILAILNAVKTI